MIVAHNVGNIFLDGATGVTLAAVDDSVTLMYVALDTQWIERARVE